VQIRDFLVECIATLVMAVIGLVLICLGIAFGYSVIIFTMAVIG